MDFSPEFKNVALSHDPKPSLNEEEQDTSNFLDD